MFRPFFGNCVEDVDLCLRILSKHKGYNMEEVLYDYRILSSSISRTGVTRNKWLNDCIARRLYQERIDQGYDSLMRKGDQFDKLYNQCNKPFIENPLKIYNDTAAFYLWYHLDKSE